MLSWIAGVNGQGRNNVPAYDTSTAKGYNIQYPENMNQQTALPLPFEERYGSTANLVGIMKATGPQMWGANQ